MVIYSKCLLLLLTTCETINDLYKFLSGFHYSIQVRVEDILQYIVDLGTSVWLEFNTGLGVVRF